MGGKMGEFSDNADVMRAAKRENMDCLMSF